VSAGKRGLPAAQNIVAAIPPSFAKIYPASRQLIPFLQLLAPFSDVLTGSFFGNGGQAFNGTYRLGEGNIQNAVTIVPTVWNESLLGWIKKLPSNRPNPYPKPGSPLEIAKGGLLSYDCRQTQNIAYLPPTGGQGAPECRLQGPWKFNGKSRFFPHLTLAKP
jgi:hypothetical protein